MMFELIMPAHAYLDSENIWRGDVRRPPPFAQLWLILLITEGRSIQESASNHEHKMERVRVVSVIATAGTATCHTMRWEATGSR